MVLSQKRMAQKLEVYFKMTTVLGVLILVCAVFLVISVLLQSSKNQRMSGVVAGGAETFFGKQKGKTIDAKLSKATAIITAVFALLVLALYIVNARENVPVVDDHADHDHSVVTDVADTDAEAEGEEGTEGEAETNEAEAE